MKNKLLTILGLFGIVKIKGIHIDNVNASDDDFALSQITTKGISISLNKVEYENDLLKEDLQLSEQSISQLAQALNITLETDQRTGLKSFAQKPSKPQYSIPMDNLKNMGYEGSIWFGNPSQQMKVIFDTGSAPAWLFSEKCQDEHCPAKNKKYLSSQSKEYRVNPSKGQTIKYGKGAILGINAKDRVCFSGEGTYCLHDLKFLSVVKGYDLQSLKGSGLVGLAPMLATEQEITDETLSAGVPGFIAQLRENNDYQNDLDSIFSIYLSNDESIKGDISFGGYNLEKFARPGAQIKWVDQAANENYWEANAKGISFGDHKDFISDPQTVIFDNGMSLAMVPEKRFTELIIKIQKNYGMACGPHRPLWVCECNENQFNSVPALNFQLVADKTEKIVEVSLPRSAFMRFDKQQGACWILLTPWNYAGIGGQPGEEAWVLGAQFLQNYYTIYNFNTKKIGLVESVSSLL